MRDYRFARTTLRSLFCAAVVGLGMTPGSAAAHAADAEEHALGTLVDAELAFARMGVERGVRAAFLANFADDGIAFEPAPVRLRETWSARPAPADPLALKLEWKPAQAGIARSLDMGYTTGPFAVSSTAQPGPARHGVFFSVWQRNREGTWKVMIDAGIATPGPVDFAALGAAPRSHYKGRAGTAREALLALEASGLATGAAAITPNAYAQHIAPDVRLHVDGVSPIASRASVAAETARRMSSVTWTPSDARVSAAADMAFTYGRYRETDHEHAVHEGFYAHLWLRDGQGAWQLAYDIRLPAQP
jgi:ketosteroid isomerase-like protein